MSFAYDNLIYESVEDHVDGSNFMVLFFVLLADEGHLVPGLPKRGSSVAMI